MGPSEGDPIRLASFLSEPRELDTVVTELQDIERRTGMERHLAIGRLILHRFFGGSPQAWHERRKNKNNSVRRLAARPGCPLSNSALNQAIGIFVLSESLPCVQTFGHIGASHIAAVLHLDLEGQRRWLEQAERSLWSVRELKEQITLYRRQTGERRGRPRAPEKGRALYEIRKCVALLEKAVETLRHTDLVLRDRGDLGRLVERLAAAEQSLARAFRRPARSEPCLQPAELAKALPPLKDAG